MTKEERTEIREMIHGMLSGWEANTISREEITNVRLGEISEHLKRINGSVAKHEKIINDNLPHNITHCPQAEKIAELDRNMISDKSVKKTLYTGIAIISTVVAIIWGISEVFFSPRQEIQSLKKQVDMINTPVQMRDGSYVLYPSGMLADSLANESGTE
jgi:hypothetical protein